MLQALILEVIERGVRQRLYYIIRSNRHVATLSITGNEDQGWEWLGDWGISKACEQCTS